MKFFKNCFAALLLLLTVTGYSQVTTFSYAPANPKQGEKVTITYDPTGTALATEPGIDAVAYTIDDKLLPKAIEVPLTKSGNKFTGTIQIPASVTAIAFSFSSGDKKDNNGKEGYYFQVYDDKQQPVPGANIAVGSIYEGSYINYILGIEAKPEEALKYAEKEFIVNPGFRKNSINSYARALMAAKKENSVELVSKALEEVQAAGNLDEPTYNLIASWYGRIKMKEKADAVKKEMKEKFPTGNWVKNEKLDAVYTEKDPAKRVELATAYLKEFPATTDAEKQQAANLHSIVANAYAGKKEWEHFKTASANMSPEAKASQYNNLAWNMAEKDDNIQLAKEMSYEATTWAKNQIDKPTTKKPDIRTEKQWKEDRKMTYSMYADTYAYIMYKMGDYKTGLTYAKEAVEIRKKKDAEYNERYATLLEKTAPAAQVKKELEPIMKEGHLGKDAKEVLKRAYTAVNKSDKGLDAYIANLEQANIEKMKEELKKKMINNEAPVFRLVNLEGSEVNLSSLKGKVVVLDFWATWCGPCKASFPAMQKAVNKYKENGNVVFLFIDTWERGADREKLVKDFIASNKYTFNVLYDTPQKQNPDDFDVVSNYKVDGIPTKFVVDGNGQIRFKSVGWSGNEDMFIKEISMMIDMAGEGGSGESSKKGF